MCNIDLLDNNWVEFLPVGILTVRASGFLYHQIRCMISILKAVGRSEITIETVR